MCCEYTDLQFANFTGEDIGLGWLIHSHRDVCFALEQIFCAIGGNEFDFDFGFSLTKFGEDVG